MITVDRHEVVNHEKAVEEGLGHRGYDVDDLPAGDFAIEGVRGEVLIERKEWSDFVSSYRSGTLFNQIGRCQEQIHDVHVLIEGSRRSAAEYTNASELEMRRMKTSLYFKTDVHVIETDSFVETLKVICDADDWLGQDPSESYHSVRPTEKVPAEDRPRYIVEGLPGIGPKNAERLLSHFSSAQRVLTATAEELQAVDGIGPRKSERIVEAMNRNHD